VRHIKEGWDVIMEYWRYFKATIFIPYFIIIAICGIVVTGCSLIESAYMRNRTIVTAPYSVDPVILYGKDTEDSGLFARYSGSRIPDRVYLLGVFRGGNVIDGVEITHKVNAEELIALLSEIRIQANTSTHQAKEKWSIYLYQNGDTHIMLGELDVIAVAGSETNVYYIADGAFIESALLHMIEKYENREYREYSWRAFRRWDCKPIDNTKCHSLLTSIATAPHAV